MILKQVTGRNSSIFSNILIIPVPTIMPPIKILIINPNTTQSMTDGLRAPVESLDYNNVTFPRTLSNHFQPRNTSISKSLISRNPISQAKPC